MPPRKKKLPPPRPRASSVLRRRQSGLNVSWWLIAAFGGLVVALIGLVAFSLRPQDEMGGMNHESLIGSPAPDVSLPLLGGGEFSLAGYQGEKNVLVYFNEGHGWDACFSQIVYLQQVKAELEAQDAVMVSVMVNDFDTLEKEAKRFEIDTQAFPFARDESGEWGKQYGAWGKGMHSANYGHGFVLIDKEGVVRWQVEEPSMYVAPKLIIEQLQEANAGPAES